MARRWQSNALCYKLHNAAGKLYEHTAFRFVVLKRLQTHTHLMSGRKEGFIKKKKSLNEGEEESDACPFVARTTASFWTMEWSYSGVQDGPEESISLFQSSH